MQLSFGVGEDTLAFLSYKASKWGLKQLLYYITCPNYSQTKLVGFSYHLCAVCISLKAASRLPVVIQKVVSAQSDLSLTSRFDCVCRDAVTQCFPVQVVATSHYPYRDVVV